VSTMVIWDDSDGIADVEYGRTFAAAVNDAESVVIERVGHVPQLESPDRVLSISSLTLP
jgi:pimeloyl-ACP methyl ester carboxylesterase